MVSTLPETSNSFIRLNTMSRRLKTRLESLLFQHTTPGITENLHGALISEPDIFTTHFNRILISALVNGCAGLQDVPIDLVLKHLMRYRHTSSMLLVFLRRSETHAAKALAENLFRAAIEARDAVALETILQIPSIDVNKISCHCKEWDSFSGCDRPSLIRPILHAANLGSLDLVRILRKAGATVHLASGAVLNRFPYNSFQRYQHDLPSTIRDYQLSIEIAKELLLAGLEVTFLDLRALAQGPRDGYSYAKKPQAHVSFDRQLVFLLASWFMQHYHSWLIPPGPGGHEVILLAEIVDMLDGSQAAALTRDMILICKREHDGVCLSQTHALDTVLLFAAKGGKLEVVQMLLPLLLHSKQLHEAFTAAITSRNDSVIDAILAHNPDLNAPAHALEPRASDSDYGTSFSQAIITGNDRIIRLIQDNGHLDVLEGGFRFQFAVTAAVKTDDLVLLRNLLGRSHHPHPSELSQALKEALKRGNEEAATILLNCGTSTCGWVTSFEGQHAVLRRYLDVEHEILLAALRDRNKGIVYALLDAWHLVPRTSSVSSKALQEAADWGDASVFIALFMAFPGWTIENDELAILLESGNHATFGFLMESGRVGPYALDRSLVYAIRKGNERMITKFLDLGANSTGVDVLEAAAEASLRTLKLIMDRKSTTRTPVRPDNGRDALLVAIQKGAQGLALAECLLHSGFVGLCIVPPRQCSSTTPEGEYTDFSAMGSAIEHSCESDEAETRFVKLFLDAGYSPDSIVRSQGIREQEYFPRIPGLYGRNSDVYVSHTTTLLLAIELLNTNMVNLFLDHGANVNLPATCRILRTPLQKACEVGSLEIVKLLLDRGADPNAPPARCQGATALQLAAVTGNCSIAAELLDRGADLHQPPLKAGGRWPLEGAAENGRLEMIEFLWKVSITGFDKPICDFATKVAERNGYLACRDLIRDLVEHGILDEGVESGILDDLLELS